MKSRKEIAKEKFLNGYNCAQAVFSAFAEKMDLAEGKALRIASGFGGGISNLQQTCGAVTGAVMVIGYLNGKTKPEQSNQENYKLVRDFIEEFEEQHSTIDCRELIEIDLNDEEELEEAREKNLFEEKCLEFVTDAIEMLETKYL